MTEKLTHNYWDYTTSILESHLKRDDVSKFADWQIMKNTMLAPNSEDNRKKLTYVLTKYAQDLDLLTESDFGNIPRVDNINTSYNLVQQLYQISLLTDVTGSINACGNILEFGGGYGSMCRLIKRMGHRHNYTICDLEAFTQLQTIFLTQNNIFGYDVVYDYGKLADEYDTLISMFAICETPHSLRDMIFAKKYKYLFFSFGANFEDMNNIDYFNRMLNDYRDVYRWTIINNELHPIAWYVIGEKI